MCALFPVCCYKHAAASEARLLLFATFLCGQPTGMEVINPNGVKVYNLSTGKSFPKVGKSSPNSRSSSSLQPKSGNSQRMKVFLKNEWN